MTAIVLSDPDLTVAISGRKLIAVCSKHGSDTQSGKKFFNLAFDGCTYMTRHDSIMFLEFCRPFVGKQDKDAILALLHPDVRRYFTRA